MIDIKEIFTTIERNCYSAFFFTPPIYKNAKSYVFLKPDKIIRIDKSNYSRNFNKIDKLLSQNSAGYSVINYETGFLFEKKLFHLLSDNNHLAQFVFFDKNNFEIIKSDRISFDFNSDYKITDFQLNTSKSEYIKTIRKIKDYIKEGETYQVNYTVKGEFNFSGKLCSLFQNLLFNQSAKYIAVVNLPDKFIISISPELFFEMHKGKISTRPMKGTVRRGLNLQADLIANYDLTNSQKDKAENVMIVDLLRNDLGRISKFGSVKVNRLFEIEKYESLFQMTSEINSTLKNGTTFSDVIKNIFPCGSVTGAPKIRTMEIIQEIEKVRRDIYTGSIGLFIKDKVTLNVAIRTLVINKKTMQGNIGLGSGIVWDSNPIKEYEEVKLKSRFLIYPQKYFEIFETVLVSRNALHKNPEIIFLAEHLSRLRATAEYFLFKFDEKELVKKLSLLLNKTDINDLFKLKIILNKYGNVGFKISKLPILPPIIKVVLSANKINSQNKFQYFKTTNRKLYDQEHKKYFDKGFFDVIYLNEKNEVAEGAITNIFIKKGGLTFTPPLSSGILPGVYRSIILKQNPEIKEKRITLDDLIKADEIILTNSVRGEIKVDEFYLNQKEYISFQKNNF